jgi:DNA-binding response OmpR family regulator
MLHRVPKQCVKTEHRVIALVSNNQPYIDVLRDFLADEGYHTVVSTKSQDAYDVICREQPSLILLDMWLEHPQAGKVLLAMLHRAPATKHIPVILCTTDVRFFRERADVLRNQHCDVILLPVALDELLAAMNTLLYVGDRSQTIQATKHG